jgi:hypothetical protein
MECLVLSQSRYIGLNSRMGKKILARGRFDIYSRRFLCKKIKQVIQATQTSSVWML